MPLQLKPLGCIISTIMLSLSVTVGSPQRLQGLFGPRWCSSPVARNQGRKQWWPEPVVFTQLAEEPSYVLMSWQRPVTDTLIVMEVRAESKAGTKYGLTGICGGPRCQLPSYGCD